GSGAAGALTVAEIMREWAARRSAEADTPLPAVEAGLARADAGRRLGGTLHALSGGRWATLESASGDEVAACEQRTLAAVTQQEAAVRRVLLRRLMELPAPAFHEAAISLLAAEGFRDIEPVAGPTPDAHGGRNEARLLRARASFGPAEIAAMVLVARVPPGKLVPSEQIALLRGRLPEVGACQGVIVTTGRIAESMHRDLVPPNAVPLLAIEQDDLLARLVRHGIGVRMRTADVPVLDPEAFGPFPCTGGLFGATRLTAPRTPADTRGKAARVLPGGGGR
ncbi:MAG: hypothetical protein QME96_16300, partial [Myxococcota bacterium]|nr:hypothetical protein [Myxococcota bacterium]